MSDALEQCSSDEAQARGRRSVPDFINILKKTKSGQSMDHVCQALTTKLGITDDGTKCPSFISCMTEPEFNTLPSCDDVQKCLAVFGSEIPTMPSCTDIMSFTKSAIRAIHDRRSRQPRSVDSWKSNLLKKTKNSEHMDHVCQALTTKLGITDDGTKCSAFVSCMTKSGLKTLPDCDDVQECLVVLGAENATIPSCSEITKFTKIAIRAVSERRSRQARSVDAWKIKLLKKTQSSENMDHVCQVLTTKLGITEENTNCTAFISCMTDSEFNTLPSCDDVQECLVVLGAENTNMPSCTDIMSFAKSAIRAVNERRSRQPRSVDSWKINILKKTESTEHMDHVCQALTTKLGITDNGTNCTAFISCMTESEFNTLPSCDDVQKCLVVLGAENTTMPSCTDIMSFAKSAIRAIKERKGRQARSVDAWKINLWKKTKNSENMEHVCQALTTKLGITDDDTNCTAFVSCMTESGFKTLPDCDDVQECLVVLGVESTNMPSCGEITQFTKSAIRAINERRSRHPRSVEDSCLTFDEIADKLEDDFSTDFCVLRNMGWMNSNDEFIEDKVVADLPEDVAAGLDNWAECTNDLVEQYAKDK